MKSLPNRREQLMNRLMSEYGFDRAKAAAAWEEFVLYVIARRICRQPPGLHIEHN